MAADGSIRIDTAIDGKGFSSGLQKLGGIAKTALTGVLTAVTSVSTALAAGATAGVKYNAQMEQYMTSFQTMLGSADAAQGMVSNLKKFAAETPFEFTDLAKGSQTLLAFGVAADDLMPTLKMLGDVSQGNAARFDALSLAFGQMSSTGRLMGQDLLQMVNAGFNPLTQILPRVNKDISGFERQMLAAGMSQKAVDKITKDGTITMAELKDAMAAGAISADMVTQAFTDATSEGGKFFNAMQAQSQTFNGQMSTLKDNAMSFLGDLTSGLTNSLKDTALPMVNGWLGQLQEAFKTGGIAGVVSSLGDVLSKAVTEAARMAPGIIDMAISLIRSFVQGIVDNIGVIIDAVVGIVDSLVSGILDLLPLFIDAGLKIIIGLANGIIKAMPKLIPRIIDTISTIINTLIENLPLLINAGVQLLQAVLNGLIQALPQIVAWIPTVVQAIIDALAMAIPLIIQAGIQLLTALIGALPQIIETIVAALPQIITSIIDAVLGAIPLLIDAGIQLLVALVEALPDIITSIVEAIPKIIEGIITAILDAIPLLIQAGIDLLIALVENLPKIIVEIVKAIPKIITGIVTALINSIPKIIEAGVKLLIALVENLPTIITEIVKAIPLIIKGIIDAFGSFIPKIIELGGNLLKGIWQGIKDAGAWLWDKISGFFGGIVDKIKNFFGIHSPSALFEKEIGKMLLPGIEIGMDKSMPSTIRDIKSKMSGMLDQARAVIMSEQARVGSLLAASANYQLATAEGPGAGIDYDAQASAFWSRAPKGETVLVMDDKVVGRILEPVISQVQGDKAVRKARIL